MSLAIGRNDDAECRGVFNTALRINLLLGGIALLVTAAIVAATPWLSHNRGDARLFQSVIAILGVNAAIGLPMRVYGGVLYTKFRFDIQSWLTILGLVLRTALIVWVILLGYSLLALAWVTLLSTLPTNILQIWFARREASWARIERKAADLKIAKSLSSYSVYTFFGLHCRHHTIPNRPSCDFGPHRAGHGDALPSCRRVRTILYADDNFFGRHVAAGI